MKEPVRRIQVVFKTHLDLGFTDSARNVVRRYVGDYIPAALRLARETRGIPERFVWTMGAWMIRRFLDEAPASARRRMEKAIAAGDIRWHALPFTTHTELMDAALFRQGLGYAQWLDRRFGKTTRAAKMTDVPGHTRAMVPLLAEAGVRLLHLGVNPASRMPAVPPVFRWKAGGGEVVVIYEKDYGATTVLPGGKALSLHLTGDNLGPQSPEQVAKVYAGLRSRFPGAELCAGSLDEASEWAWTRRESLPVVTAEIGDTWIHGVGTDPAKTARFRALCRLRSEWIGAGRLEAGGKIDAPFADNLLCVAEHTWGLDLKTHLRDWRAYSPTALRRALPKPRFQDLAASWEEQRAYVKAAVRALPPGLAAEARRELSALRPRPGRGAWKALPLLSAFCLKGWTLALDDEGAIQYLRREGAERPVADARHRLGAFSHQTFSAADTFRFLRRYNTLDKKWVRQDFTKPGMPAGVAARHRPVLVGLEVRAGEARARLRFSVAARRAGAPAGAVLFLSPCADGLDLRLEWEGKAATRMPEALWMAFRPRGCPPDGWRIGKLGTAVDPLDVARDGARHLHAADGAVSCGDFSVYSVDAPLVAPGTPRLLDFTNRLPDLARGVSFNLYNNVWGTNFPMWRAGGDVFRFRLRWKPERARPAS